MKQIQALKALKRVISRAKPPKNENHTSTSIELCFYHDELLCLENLKQLLEVAYPDTSRIKVTAIKEQCGQDNSRHSSLTLLVFSGKNESVFLDNDQLQNLLDLRIQCYQYGFNDEIRDAIESFFVTYANSLLARVTPLLPKIELTSDAQKERFNKMIEPIYAYFRRIMSQSDSDFEGVFLSGNRFANSIYCYDNVTDLICYSLCKSESDTDIKGKYGAHGDVSWALINKILSDNGLDQTRDIEPIPNHITFADQYTPQAVKQHLDFLDALKVIAKTQPKESTFAFNTRLSITQDTIQLTPLPVNLAYHPFSPNTLVIRKPFDLESDHTLSRDELIKYIDINIELMKYQIPPELARRIQDLFLEYHHPMLCQEPYCSQYRHQEYFTSEIQSGLNSMLGRLLFQLKKTDFVTFIPVQAEEKLKFYCRQATQITLKDFFAKIGVTLTEPVPKPLTAPSPTALTPAYSQDKQKETQPSPSTTSTDGLPELFGCSVTLEDATQLQNVVFCPLEGRFYAREEGECWVKNNHTTPHSRLDVRNNPLAEVMVPFNPALYKAAAEAFIQLQHANERLTSENATLKAGLRM